jgi:hypothetical protein
MPDLSATTVSGDQDNPLKQVHEIRRTIVEPTPRYSNGKDISPAAPEGEIRDGDWKNPSRSVACLG